MMIYLLSVVSFAGLAVALAAMLMIAERLLINYGICKLDINAGEKPLELEGGQTLLASLYANEVFIPSACGGKGTCGHCKITVTGGGGPVYTAVVESSVDLTYDMKEIRLRLNEPPDISHRPGQYVQVQAPSPEGPVFRAYSISSPVYEPNIVQLVVRLVPGGIGSTYLHNVKPGDSVNFTGPYGEFWLSEDPSVEIICVGGGCGIAPIRNIVYTLYERWPDRVCWLFFGCRTTRDVFYLEQLEELAKKYPNFHVVYALSDQLGEDEKWDGEIGFIHLSVDKYLEPGVRRQAFLCGPPLMIEAVTRVLKEKGTSDIFYDEF